MQVDLAGDAPVFKEGEVYRKNVMEGPNKKGNHGCIDQGAVITD